MPHCHHHHHATFDLTFLPEGIGIILTLFLNGLVGSFTHCIGMCGPIAFTQLSLKLMNHPKEKLTEVAKMKAALLLPYYFGKAATYGIFGIVFYLFSTNLSGIPYASTAAGVFLILTALLFVKAAISKKFGFFTFLESSSSKVFSKQVARVNKRFSLNPYGFRGFILGMILGLIPCGLVYSSLVSAVAGSSNMLIAFLSMFVFGIGTVPGLYVSAYAGGTIINSFKKLFSLIFSITMLINAYLLIRYALKLF